MKPTVYIVIALISIAVLLFAYQGITYKTPEKSVDFGPLQISIEHTHTIPLASLIGGLALVAGIVLIIVNNKKS